MEKIIILHNIRSQHNVGSIFRTADASGVSKIYLTGYTPAPIDRFGRKVGTITKVSLGAEEFVPWEKKEDISEVLDNLDAEIVAMEQDSRSINYKKYKPTGSVAYIFGDEVRGIPKKVLSRSDFILEIPMRGQKESLNVSVTAGIILFN